ncbi:MAG: PD40 domain-containing protein [Ardenticatenaceae bacterium]|nr:PD40 domain-containing protein [Ardenticatenaceae bacterium]
MGRWLWLNLVVRWWRFTGRMGLAIRNLLTWTVWRPFLWIFAPFRFLWRQMKKVLRPIWRFMGRLGLALRRLLTLFIWRPLAWLYRVLVRPFLSLITGFIRKRWQATEPRRQRLNRRWASYWNVRRARWRVFWRRPRPPKTAVTAPRIPDPYARRMRWITALASVGIVLVVSFATLQEQQPDQVAAGVVQTRIIEVTSTPGPVTPTPRPTIPVQLTPWATPDPTGSGGSLAFVQDVNGNSDIYILPVGQAEPVRLTSHPAVDRDPVWSPDGQELAFSSHRDGNWELYVYNFPAGRLRRVTHDLAFDSSPSWSPDGQWLVYESYQAQNFDIYIVKADGSDGPYRLTEDPALDFAPVWSPQGRHIAFVSWRGGGPDIFMLSLDAVSDETAVNLTRSPDIYESHPVFAPNGRFLAYSDDRADFPLLYALPLRDGVNPSGPAVSLGDQGRDPAWSPDSQSLVFVYSRNGQDYLFTGSPESWGVSPQVFVGNGRLSQPSWFAVSLTPEMVAAVRQVEPADDQPLFIEAVAKVADSAEKEASQLLYELPVNAPSPYLSDQVDQSFTTLRQRVMAEAGWDFLAQLDNMFEPIDARPLPGQSAQSWNKAGRAFDFYYREALAFEPRVEVVRENVGTETYWRVFIKTEAQDGSQGEPLRSLPWDFQARYGDEPRFYDEGGKVKDSIPPGYYVDFTALATDYGWQRVPATSNWRAYFPAINFWHFENRQDLTWEEAMLELYTVGEFAAVFGNP